VRIVFVDNLLLERNGGLYDYVLQPHLGLLSLIAVAEAAGHQGILYDPKLAVAHGGLTLDQSLYREIAHDILRTDPDVVGMTSLGCNFICTLKVAAYIRSKRPELPILLGGPHATVLDRAILERFPQFDLIVRNEAELKLLPLFQALADGRLDNVPGITYRQRREVVVNPGEPVIQDLDSLPLGAYDHYPIEALKLKWLRVEAGRGCPFMCSFCSTAAFFGRRYRLKSAERLRADLDTLNARYGVTHFSLTHDLFTVNRSKVVAFCREVTGRGYTWKCSARMDCVDSQLLEIMYEAGCREIYYGVETGSDRMQRLSQKRLNLSLFRPTLEATERIGMAETVSFITGYPQEEKPDQDQTLDMIGSCFYRERPPHYVQLHLLTPEPGTQLLAEFRQEIDYDGYVTDFNFPTLEDNDSAVMQDNPDIFVNHHYFRSALLRRRHVFVTSLYSVLYRLGSLVLTALLDRYDGRLSRLVDAMEGWANIHAPALPVREDALPAFCEASWGPGDWLTSLVRYKVAGIKLAQRLRPGRRSSTNGPSSPAVRSGTGVGDFYRLSAKAIVLRDLHDCPEILDRLSKSHRAVTAADIPLDLISRRSHYLLLADREANVLRNFELDDRSATLIEAFRGPRETQNIAMPLTGKETAPVLALCGELVRLGVLEPASSASQPPPGDSFKHTRMKLGEWGELRA
jgi:Radical SAM superfamily/B12 binding domain